MFQLGASLPVEIEHIVQRNGGDFSEKLLVLVQSNCWRHDSPVEPYIFRDVITIPTLLSIILEFGKYEFSIIQLSVVLEK